MNYYSHHIGDFNNATRHLTRIERSIYRDMLDMYYDTEKPLMLDGKELCRKLLARTDEDVTAVQQVLNEFFTETASGWYHSRCETEIQEYHSNISAKSAAGKASAAKREAERLANLNRCSTGVEQVLNSVDSSVQLTNNQEPITNNQINTPIPPAGKKKKSNAVALKTFLDDCKESDVKPIPDTDPVLEYAEKAGIPSDFLWLQWREFLDRYKQPDAKMYKDWRAVFRKSVRGNWFKLWFIDGKGQYVLTTQGAQAQNIHKGKAP